MAKGNTIGSVYVRVRPKVVDGLRRRIEREFEKDLKDPIEVRAETRLDPESTRRSVRQAQREADRAGKATIKFSPDFDGVNDGIKRLKNELKSVERHEVEFDADTSGLKRAIRELQDNELPGAEVRMEFVPDEEGYRSILRRIESIRRENLTKEIEFSTDESSLAEVEREARSHLEAIKAKKPIHFEYVDDEESRRSLMQRIEELRREEIEIDVDLDTSNMDISQAVQELKGKDVSLTPKVNPVGAAVVEATLASLARDRWVDLKPRLSKRAMATLQGSFMAIAGINSIGHLIRQIENIALNFDDLAVAGSAAGAAIGSLVSVGTVGLGALLNIAGDTLQVFQGLAMAPALMLSAATGLQTWNAIWQDFGAALQGIPGVLEEMPPAAQRAVGAVQDLNTAVNQTVQNNFWGQMTDEVERFTENIGPHVVEAMGQTATVLGRTVSTMLDHTEMLANNGSLERFTKNNTVFMAELGGAAEVAFEALMHMGVQGSQYLPALGRGIRNVSNDFSDFISHATRTGQFDRWIQNSINSMQSLGQFSKAVWDTLAGITRAFDNVGGAGLHEMADGMERISDWVNSSGTQSKMEGIFRAAMDGAASAGRGFADLMKTMWDLDDVINELLRTTGQLAGDFMSQIASLDFTVAADGMFDLFDGMIDFVNMAGPGFQSIVDIFGRLSSIGGEVAREIAHGLNLTMGAIDGFIARIQGPLINAIHPLTRVFEDIAAAATPALFAIADSIGVVLNLFSALPEPIQNTIVMLGILARTGAFAAFATGAQRMTAGMATASAGVATHSNRIATSTQNMSMRAGTAFSGFQRQLGRIRGTVAIQTAGITGAFQRMQTGVRSSMGMMGSSIGRGFSGLAAVVGGPWGIALTAAVGTLTAFAGESAQAEARQRELANTVSDTTGQLKDQASVTIFENMTRDTDGWIEKIKAGGIDVQRTFDDLGISVEGLAGRMGDSTREVTDMHEAAKGVDDALTRVPITGAVMTNMFGDAKIDLEGMSAESRALYESLNLSEASGREINAVLEHILGTTEPIVRASREAKDRMHEIGIEGMIAKGEIEGLESAMNGVPAYMESSAEAMSTLADNSASAESRVSALSQMLRDMSPAGNDFSDDLWSEAIRSTQSAMSDIEQLASDGGFDASQAFNEAGEFDLSEGIEAVEIRDAVLKLQDGISAEIEANKADFDAELIDGDTFRKNMEDLRKSYEPELRNMAEKLGMGKAETEAFVDFWNDRFVLDEKTIELIYEGKEVLDQASEDFKGLFALGMDMTEAEFIATLDANGDGVVSEVERAEGLGRIFDREVFIAGLDADDKDFQLYLDAAMTSGLYFDGENFVAALDADGQPVLGALDQARERGNAFDGEKFVAQAEVTNDATDGIEAAFNSAQTIWNGKEFVAKLGADGQPTDAAMARAQELGLGWDGHRFVAVVDAEGDGAIEEVTAAREAADKFNGTYQALLEADMDDGMAAKIAAAVSEAEGFEGDYQAMLDVLQDPDGQQALSDMLEDLEGLDGKEALAKILALVDGEQDVQNLIDGVDEVDGKEGVPHIRADTGTSKEDVEGIESQINDVGLIEAVPKVGVDSDEPDVKLPEIGGLLNTLDETVARPKVYQEGAEAAMGEAELSRQSFLLFNDDYTGTLHSEGGGVAADSALTTMGHFTNFEGSYVGNLLSQGAGEAAAAAEGARTPYMTFEDTYMGTLTEQGSGDVIERSDAARMAAHQLEESPFVARFSSEGGPQVAAQIAVIQAALRGFTSTPYVAQISATGAVQVIAQVSAAQAAGRAFARPYIATIREVGAALVMSRINAARTAATVFASRPYIARLSEIGSAQVISAAMRAQATATRFARTPYIARLQERGSQQVMAAAARAGAAATRFARVYSATITERGSGSVVSAANSVYNALSRINRTVHVRFTSSGAGALSRAAAIARSNADGSLSGSRFKPGITRFDNGGVNFGPKPTTAHIAPAGSYVMYAERETGGEAFIPLAASKRNRSVAIWEETGRRLNVLADGDITGGSGATASGDVYNINVTRSDASPKEIIQELNHETRKSRRR